MKRRLWLKIFASLSVVLILLAASAWFSPQQVLTLDNGPVKADAMVVLGGGGHERPQRAAELFKQGEAPLIICSGYGDSGAFKAQLVKSGVPASAVLLEAKSHTTRENAEFTIAMLREAHIKSAIIVTSWYHSRRALHCFEHFAPEIKFYSRPSYFAYPRAEWRPKGISSFVKSEYLKLLGYWVCYGVCPL